MKSIEKEYEDAFEQLAAIQPVFPEQAKRQMAEMVEIIAKSNKHIDTILARKPHPNPKTDIGIKCGSISEEVHAETFNLDAIYKGDSSRAYTDKYNEWSNHEWIGNKLHTNDVPDLIICKDGKVIQTAQAKYYCTPEKTAEMLCDPKYKKMDILLGPSDQINPSYSKAPGESEPVQTTTVGEHVEARTDAQTAAKCKDRISDGKASSTPLSKADAEEIASGDKRKLQKIESKYQTKSTLKQMGNAAVGAAAMSAVISGSINTIKYVQLAREGKLTVEEATLKIVGETVASAADSAIKASANTGVQSLIVRFGSEEAAKEILARQGLKTMLKGNAVTIGVVCAVDMVKDLVLLGTDKITKEQFYERQGKGVLNTAAGVVGGTLGTAAAGGIAAIAGIEAGTIGMAALSVVGGLSGGLIAGLAMSFAIENGIERPYRDLLRNTQSLNETACVLERVSQNVFKGQILFTKYLEADQKMEKDMQIQMGKVDEAGQRALDAINLI